MMLLQPRVAQELGAGEWGDEGDASVRGHGGCRARRRRADFTDQREHLIDLDEVQGVGDRGLRLVGVVEGGELQSPSMDAASFVRLMEGGEDAEPHVRAERLSGAAEGGRLTENDTVVEDP